MAEKLLYELLAILTHLRSDWDLLRAIFRSEEMLDLMARRTERTFALLNHLGARHIALEIAKLMDPMSHGRGRANLSFEYALQELSISNESRDELGRQLEMLRARVAPITRLRHKFVAHNDLATVRQEAETHGVTYRHLDRAVSGAEEYYVRLRREIEPSFRLPAPPSPVDDEALRLNEILRRGNEALDRQ